MNDLSDNLLKLLNDLKQYYEMKPESIDILKEKIFNKNKKRKL